MSRNPIAAYTHRGGFRMGQVEFKDFLWEALMDPSANVTMGDTAENLARQYQITRAEVDAFAARSFERAVAATGVGLPRRRDRAGDDRRRSRARATTRAASSSRARPRSSTADTHVRASSRRAAGEDPPAFGGVQTGGNSSAIVDGAAAALVASGDYAKNARQGAARPPRRGRRGRRAARNHGHRPGAGDPGRARDAPA